MNLLVTLALVLAAAAPTDPLEEATPTPEQIAGSVTLIPLESSVTLIPLEKSVTSLEQERREQGEVVVRLDADILFAFGRADLSPAAREAITRLAGRLPATGQIEVVGHTDAVGSPASNVALSRARAQAVAAALAGVLGGQQRLVVDGRGETQPVADNDDPEGAALNRRVEIRYRG